MDFRLKAQVAMEFMMLIFLAFMIMIVFTIMINNRMIDLRSDEEFNALKDVAFAVQSEIFTASYVEDGYIREFELPALLDGVDYTLDISSGYLIAESTNHEYSLKVAPVTGSLIIGSNTIKNQGGAVYLNP